MKDFRYLLRHRIEQLRRKMERPRRFAPVRRAKPRIRRLAPAAWLAAPLLAGLLLPLAVVPLRGGQPALPAVPPATASPAPPAPAAKEAPQPKVSVYLSHSGQIETLPLEEYVSGVVAAEMPPGFELEALKAQAVAARTFIVRRLQAGDHSGVPVPGADVTDTVSHQAYVSKAALERKWTRGGRSAELAKVRRAVLETRGVVMTYQGQPITASFFASSGGYTENSEDYWNAAVPYLRSVASPWDQDITPNLAVTYTFSNAELIQKLGIAAAALPASRDLAASGPAKPVSSSSASGLPAEVLSLTAGHRVQKISIGGMVFTGREVREKLGLRSSQFTWKRKGNKVLITTYGNGHGVGMSQWGANGMAKQGSTATQILKHYYSGISFNQVSTLLKK
ncbi:stage II sporulation protein D [Paenibacillus riograndensis]|uniref:Stage II sporulation protein d n=2 Tax=Paenibacillus riograndensis TaxID=483937 RepID=A0A0E4CZL1_9BACL|nr:stage II sporulation protein D [Paenibacillus riograndensis]CQR58657.1 stage II sporulation protein d [Paenibacillus riograndensis SBR5]